MPKKPVNKVATPKAAETATVHIDPAPEPITTPVPEVHDSNSANLHYGSSKSGTITVALLIALMLVIAGLGITQHLANTHRGTPNYPVVSGDGTKVVVDDGTGTATETTAQKTDPYVAPYYSKTKVGGLNVTVDQDLKDRKSYSVYLVNSKKLTITSDSNPSVIPLKGNDLRFIISKSAGLNNDYYLVNQDGSMKSLMTETDDTMILGMDADAVSRDNTKIVYTVVTAMHDTCGGPVDQKIPNYSGPVLELRSTNLATGATIVVIPDENTPVPGTSGKLYGGVELLGYSADSSKAILAKRPIHACGAFEDLPAFVATIAQHGTVTQIPFQTSPGDNREGAQATGVSPDGKYLYYTEYFNGDSDDIVHRYDLATGADTIIK